MTRIFALALDVFICNSNADWCKLCNCSTSANGIFCISLGTGNKIVFLEKYESEMNSLLWILLWMNSSLLRIKEEDG